MKKLFFLLSIIFLLSCGNLSFAQDKKKQKENPNTTNVSYEDAVKFYKAVADELSKKISAMPEYQQLQLVNQEQQHLELNPTDSVRVPIQLGQQIIQSKGR